MNLVNSYNNLVETLELIRKQSKPSLKQKLVYSYLKTLNEQQLQASLYILDPHIREKKLINISTRSMQLITGISMPELNYNKTIIDIKLYEGSIKLINSENTNKIVIKNINELVKLVSRPEVNLRSIIFEKGFNCVQWIPMIFTVLKLLEGTGSRRKKEQWILYMLQQYDTLGGLYLIRILLNNLRVGLKNSLVLKPLAELKNIPLDVVKAVYNTTPLLLSVLKPSSIQIGTAIKPMLLKFCKKSILSKLDYKQYVYEYKFDGLRVQIHFKDGNLNVFSRNLLNLSSAIGRYVVRDLPVEKLKNCILDAELCGVDFQTITQVIMRKHEKQALNLNSFETSLKVFDILLLNNTSLLTKPYIERKTILKQYLQQIGANCYVETYNIDEELFKKILNKTFQCYNYEGLVLKQRLSPYMPNERSNKWIKVKPSYQEADAVILEGMQGNGAKAVYYSSFNIGLKNKFGEVIEVGQIGSGFSIADLQYIKDLYGPVQKSKKFTPPLVIKVQFQNVQKSSKYTSGYSLRFPIFKGFRPDKTFEDIDKIENYD